MFFNKRKYFEKHKAEFSRWLDQQKPIDFAKLERCFVDSNGKQYYRFTEALQLPIERWGKAKDFMQWMAAGISGNELDKLLDFADDALQEGIKKGKAASRIGFALQELRERKTMIVHSELLYNFLAVHWIREDEKITVIDEKIQQQKVEQFKKEVENSDTYFFFQERELKKIYDHYDMSLAELTKYFQDAIIKQKALQTMLQKYSSDIGSERITTDGILS